MNHPDATGDGRAISLKSQYAAPETPVSAHTPSAGNGGTPTPHLGVVVEKLLRISPSRHRPMLCVPAVFAEIQPKSAAAKTAKVELRAKNKTSTSTRHRPVVLFLLPLTRVIERIQVVPPVHMNFITVKDTKIPVLRNHER